MSESQGNSAGMDSSDATSANSAPSASRAFLISGLVAVVVVAVVSGIGLTAKSDAPRSGTATCATTSQGCEIGDIGPGGGKVYSLGGATSPADCTTVVCLEVAPLGWQETPSATTDLSSNWSTATSTVAGYSTTNAAAGTWRLPTQAELTTLATLSSTDQAKVNGFRDVSSPYWSSTTGSTYTGGPSVYEDSAYVRSNQTSYEQIRLTNAYTYSRPIHPF